MAVVLPAFILSSPKTATASAAITLMPLTRRWGSRPQHRSRASRRINAALPPLIDPAIHDARHREGPGRKDSVKFDFAPFVPCTPYHEKFNLRDVALNCPPFSREYTFLDAGSEHGRDPL